MSRENQQKPVALVTGSSSGFGLHTCLALAADGFEVIATMRNVEKQEELRKAAAHLQLATSIQVMELDVTNPAQIQAVMEQIRQAQGKIDVLVNNAGYACGGAVVDVPLTAWRQQLETNFFGLVAVTKAALPLMQAQDNGKVINMSSIAGRMAFPGYAPYSASKFAIEGFSESLRFELRPLGIHVILVEPGAYRTDIWQKGFNTIHRPAKESPYNEMMNAILHFSHQSAQNAPLPNEVGKAVAKIARSRSPRLRYVMGKGTVMLLLGKLFLPWKWLERLFLRVLHSARKL